MCWQRLRARRGPGWFTSVRGAACWLVRASHLTCKGHTPLSQEAATLGDSIPVVSIPQPGVSHTQRRLRAAGEQAQ